MNPPFSALANVTGKVQDAAFRHIASALARLALGGRLVTITGAGFGPDMPAWRDAFVRLQERGQVVFSAAVDGSVYARHGTTFPTRLTVIDKIPSKDPTRFPVSPGLAPNVAALLGWIADPCAAASYRRIAETAVTHFACALSPRLSRSGQYRPRRPQAGFIPHRCRTRL